MEVEITFEDGMVVRWKFDELSPLEESEMLSKIENILGPPTTLKA